MPYENEIVRTLGLHQPFAGLMLHDKVETRWVRQGRKAPFPLGKYMIYSTLTPYSPHETSLIAGNQYDRIRDLKSIYRPGVVLPEFIKLGHGLCVGDLEKVIYIIPNDAIMERETFVHYTGPVVRIDKKGREQTYILVGLVFKNIQKIEPFRFKGKQGIGFLSDADKSKIKLLTN